MAQDYDKIFRENIEQVIITLDQKLLGIDPAKYRTIHNIRLSANLIC